MKGELHKLRKKLAEQEKKLHSTVKRLHSTTQLKENMERIIIDQREPLFPSPRPGYDEAAAGSPAQPSESCSPCCRGGLEVSVTEADCWEVCTSPVLSEPAQVQLWL